jgi:hypothetical protein
MYYRQTRLRMLYWYRSVPARVGPEMDRRPEPTLLDAPERVDGTLISTGRRWGLYDERERATEKPPNGNAAITPDLALPRWAVHRGLGGNDAIE